MTSHTKSFHFKEAKSKVCFEQTLPRNLDSNLVQIYSHEKLNEHLEMGSEVKYTLIASMTRFDSLSSLTTTLLTPRYSTQDVKLI